MLMHTDKAKGGQNEKGWEGSHMQSMERGSEGSNPTGTLILDLQPPECNEMNFWCLSQPVCVILLQQSQ